LLSKKITIFSFINKATIIVMTKTTKIKIGRDAGSGQFIPVKEAERRPKQTVVETIKIKR
ncbi:hypothetical protein, partial [Larkinella rosea]|uniref:hypothetical protein n=1 Tax=Larkinella rosea TaxID=2025312 RepID=UPI001C899C8A